MNANPAAVAALVGLAEQALAARAGLVVLGLSGAQGSGKSTLAAALIAAMRARGIACAALSLDDLYLARRQRALLARTVHPLFVTRGVPGTHDVALGLATLDALARGEPALLPRFDKASDDPLPQARWPRAPRATRLLVFEGWCLGARPCSSAALATPVNALEAEEDAHAIWRSHVNAQLAGVYARLWARIDALAMLAAPGFACVVRWRAEQEARLRAAGGRGAGVMNDAAIARFVAHYERLTRNLLADLPQRADLVIALDEHRAMLRATRRKE